MLHLVQRLAPSYPWNSPYAFSENRVVDSRELEGLERISINSPYWVDRLDKVLAMPEASMEEKQSKARGLHGWMTDISAAARVNPNLVLTSDYVNKRGGINEALVVSPVGSNREMLRFENAVEEKADLSRNYEGAWDGSNSGEIYADHMGVTVSANFIPFTGGSFSLTFGWVKGEGFALMGTVGGGGGWDWSMATGMPSLAITPQLGFYDSDGYQDKPKWGGLQGLSSQEGAGLGRVGLAFSQSLEVDTKTGEVIGFGKWNTVGISISPGGAGVSGSIQISNSFLILGGND